MPKKLTHTAAFDHFGTSPRNVRWSWSARNEESKTVVVTLWQDKFVNHDGRLVYVWRQADAPDTRSSFKELMENLAWSRLHCEGRFNVITAVAKDKTATPRSIKECFPSNFTMRLTHLDTAAGTFTAESINEKK